MNDYGEVEIDESLLMKTFYETYEGNRLKSMLHQISNKLWEELIVRYYSSFNAWIGHFCLIERKIWQIIYVVRLCS